MHNHKSYWLQCRFVDRCPSKVIQEAIFICRKPHPHLSGSFKKCIIFICFGLASTRRKCFRHRKQNFSKRLSGVSIFENAILTLSCRWVKTELFENAELQFPTHQSRLSLKRGMELYNFSIPRTHSIPVPFPVPFPSLEMHLVLWGSFEGMLLVCFLLSKFEC